jgi:hypothetical protein
MDFLFDLLQGAGIAAAVGIRPFLPVLLVGALAAGDLGIDFEGTDFAFLESWPFLISIVVLVAVADLAARRRGYAIFDTGAAMYALLALSVALGALEAAGSLADRGHEVWPGVIVGAACAVLGFVTARAFLLRVRRRLDDQVAGTLTLYADGAGLLAAGLSVLFPPLALVVLAVLGWLLVGGRRRDGEKYAGLRILR